jgi:inosine-uridine nucleoside N-ribohydrolase
MIGEFRTSCNGGYIRPVSSPRRILIDTDPGIDDAMAIFYALASPELEVVGLTTVFGNAHTDVCTTNALRLLDIAGRPDIPVAQGASRPLTMNYRGPVAFVHGEDGQGNTFLPPSIGQAVAVHAAQFIIDSVMASPGEITIVLLGPFTNMALAMLMQPDLTTFVKEIVVMGGAAFTHGNASPASEANVLNDPEAADIVFGAACPMVMAGLDVTHRITMTSDDLDRFGAIAGARAAHLAAIVPYYAAFYLERNHVHGIYVHDSTTISYLLAPHLFTWKELPVRVDTGHSVCRGRTLAAFRDSDDEGPWAGRRPVRILTDVDSRGVIELEFEHLGR